jgi:hypothetical protein
MKDKAEFAASFVDKSSGGVNQRKRVGITYLPTMEVKNVNRCFRHLLITFLGLLSVAD